MRSDTFQALMGFVRDKMQMQHIYQPVMLNELLSHHGACSIDHIARAFLAHDDSQIDYYGEVTKRMPGDVLAKRGIVEKEKEGNKITGYRLIGFESLSGSEIAELLELCNQRLQTYLAKHGDSIWEHRSQSDGYISGTLRYEIFKRARSRCELCGVPADQKALQVDHIIPRNKNGSDDLSNLQALCYSCNAMKRDRDDTDFRGMADSYQHREEGCLFCGIDPSRVIAEDELCYAIRDGYPVTPSHTLVIPKRHVADYFQLYQPELNSAHRLMAELKAEIEGDDPEVTSFNVGVNAGEDAGQTIFHCHIHLIPRRSGDVEDPRGGVRYCIPDKGSYEDD